MLQLLSYICPILISNAPVVKIKLLFDYSTLYLFKIFVILNYDDPLKKNQIYLFTYGIVQDNEMR